MLVLSIILGCLVGFSFAYMMIGLWVIKSNNHGDSKGTFVQFCAAPLHVIRSQDHIKKPKK